MELDGLRDYCYERQYVYSIGLDFSTITTAHSDSVQVLIDHTSKKLFVEVFPIKGKIIQTEFNSLDSALKAFEVWEHYMKNVVYENFKMF